MHKKVAKLDRDFHKFLALLGLTTQHYGHRHRSKMLTKRTLPRVSGARASRRPTRPGMGAARAKSQRDRPFRALNRGTGAPGVGDVSTPSNSNRKRRRTQEEVHGAVRTRPASGRLTAALKTPRVVNFSALPSPCRPALATVERGNRQLTDEERTQLATAARFARHTGTVSRTELARTWKITTRALYNIVNRQRETGSAAALPRSGRPNVLTDADESVLVVPTSVGSYRRAAMSAAGPTPRPSTPVHNAEGTDPHRDRRRVAALALYNLYTVRSCLLAVALLLEVRRSRKV